MQYKVGQKFYSKFMEKLKIHIINENKYVPMHYIKQL